METSGRRNFVSALTAINNNNEYDEKRDWKAITYSAGDLWFPKREFGLNFVVGDVGAKKSGFELYDKPRGAPENVGSELKAIHPVVRTNPVTGWKSIFPVGGHVQHINGLTDEESKKLLDWFVDLVYRSSI